MNKTKYTHFITVLLAVVVMVLPYGGVLKFVTPHDSGATTAEFQTYSYFNPILYGYGNVGPLLTAILTSALLLVLVVLLMLPTETHGAQVVITTLSALALVTSLLPLVMFGAEYFTMAGLLIAFLLVCSLIMSVQRLTGKYFLNTEETDA